MLIKSSIKFIAEKTETKINALSSSLGQQHF